MDSMVTKFEQLWRSERLVYKGVSETEECKSLLHRVMSDPVIDGLSTLSPPKPLTRKDSDKCVSNMIESSHIMLLICMPKVYDEDPDKGVSQRAVPTSGEPIGYIQLSKTRNRSGQIGLSLLPAYQGKGYGRESINQVLDWGFRWADLHRISIGTVSFNERAVHLHKSIGFVEEGRAREAVYKDLEWYDLVDFGMLLREWKTLRGLHKGIKARTGSRAAPSASERHHTYQDE